MPKQAPRRAALPFLLLLFLLTALMGASAAAKAPLPDPATDPIGDPVSDPIGDPVSDPISDPANDPVSDRAPQGTWRLGALALLGPDVPGSREAKLRVVPLIEYSFGPWTFGGRTLLTYTHFTPLAPAGDFPRAEGIRTVGGFGFDTGQDGPGGLGAPKVDFAPTAFAKVTYEHPFYEASLDMRQRLSADQRGATLTLGVGSGYPVADGTFLAVGLGLEYGDADHRETFFALPDAGWTKAELGLTLIHTVNARLTLIAGARVTQWDDGVTALPWVEEALGIGLNAGFAYTL